MTRRWKLTWRYGRALIIPLLLWCLVAVTLWEPLKAWLEGSELNDRAILREWIREARGFRDTLPTMVEKYIQKKKEEDPLLGVERAKIEEHLSSLGVMITRMYSNQLPLFPMIFRIEVEFAKEHDLPPIIWSSELPHDESQRKHEPVELSNDATAHIYYQLHAFDKRQREKELRALRARNLSLLAVIATGLAIGWVIFGQHRERQRERAREKIRQDIDEKERKLLEEELKRQEAERQKEEAERDLLQQRLAAQTSERELLEVKSQLLASIGIMAGSYAHNIKNLLVRPNDLLQRCLDDRSLSGERAVMIREVKDTLGTVTERLQQILQTVRRDPSHSEMSELNVSQLLRELQSTWHQMGEKWKLQIHLDLPEETLKMKADRSHLQQAIENLLFNARDAIFAMRNHRRTEARTSHPNDPTARQQAILQAAAWKGNIWIRGRREGDEVIIEVQDDGIGMDETTKKHCTETHFSTKRNDAVFEGQGAGMGLGLSFVQVILQHHNAELEISTAPLQGATFVARFPLEAGNNHE